MRDHRDFGHVVGSLEKRRNHAGHIEYLECARENRQRFGVDRLGSAFFEDAESDAATRAFIGEEEADRARAGDQHIGFDCGVWHVFVVARLSR